MSFHNTMPTAAPATLAIDGELQDLDLGPSNIVALPTKSPEPKSAIAADSKPLDGEITPPTKSGTAVAAPTADNDAQFAPIADRIRSRTQRGVLMLVENGRDLITVKEKMGHGRFGDWVKREFGWSERTAQNYMNAAKASNELAGRGCAPEAIAFLSPTMLYNFDKQPEELKGKFVKNIISGEIAAAMKKAKSAKPTTSKKSSAASTDKNEDAAEELAKRIAGALPHAARQEIDGHPGFNAPAFGGLLSKAIAASFGVPSNGGAE